MKRGTGAAIHAGRIEIHNDPAKTALPERELSQMEKTKLDNDKVFTTYALTLILGVAAVIAFTLAVGFAELPPPLLFVQELALALLIRASYKSFGGFDWILPARETGEAVEAAEAADAAHSGATA